MRVGDYYTIMYTCPVRYFHQIAFFLKMAFGHRGVVTYADIYQFAACIFFTHGQKESSSIINILSLLVKTDHVGDLFQGSTT